MIAVWCNEGPVYEDKDGNFYGITINDKIINRYLEYVDKIYMLTRVRKIKKDEKRYSKISNNEKIEIISIPNCSSIKGILFNTKKAKKIIEQYIEKVDIVFIGLPSILGNLAVSICNKKNKNYILEVLACPFDSLWNYGNIKGKIMAPIQYLVTRKKIKDAANVVYVSNEFLQNRYPNNKNNIGCSDVIIDNIDIKNLEKRIEKINKYDLSYEYNIGLMGSLDLGYKGHDTAIRAVALLKDKYKIKLHFLGKGNPEKWKKQIKKYNLEHNVIFDGTLPAGEPVLNWMDEMDIFLIPSLQEGLPRGLVEAMSRACPAIGVKTGGIPELISKQYIAEKKDFKKIAKMIEQMIVKKENMIEQAQYNFNKSLNYEKEKLYKKRKEFYNNIIIKNN